MGTLYIVATPIGNLEDITLRALRILKEVDLIVCEDTRITRRLLAKYSIDTPTNTYHQHSADEPLIQKIAEGKNIALVTDAGTPGVQDPGGRLVEAARRSGANVVPIPGASALTTALSTAGIGADAFYFVGFLPKKQGRQTLFKELAESAVPVVLYESPMRVNRTLADILTHLGNRQLIVARELTKKFEEFKFGTAEELAEAFVHKKPQGEFVIIILPEV